MVVEKDNDEDILHCIRDCVFAKSIWLGLDITNRQGSRVLMWYKGFKDLPHQTFPCYSCLVSNEFEGRIF